MMVWIISIFIREPTNSARRSFFFVSIYLEALKSRVRRISNSIVMHRRFFFSLRRLILHFNSVIEDEVYTTLNLNGICSSKRTKQMRRKKKHHANMFFNSTIHILRFHLNKYFCFCFSFLIQCRKLKAIIIAWNK